MLEWMSAALALGTDPKDFAKEKDCAAFKNDADFKKLVARKRNPKEEVHGEMVVFGNTFVETKDGDHIFAREIESARPATIYGLGNRNKFPLRLLHGRKRIELPPKTTRFEADGFSTPFAFRILVSTDDLRDPNEPIMLGYYYRE